jgi:hypothetical protein
MAAVPSTSSFNLPAANSASGAAGLVGVKHQRDELELKQALLFGREG